MINSTLSSLNLFSFKDFSVIYPRLEVVKNKSNLTYVYDRKINFNDLVKIRNYLISIRHQKVSYVEIIKYFNNSFDFVKNNNGDKNIIINFKINIDEINIIILYLMNVSNYNPNLPINKLLMKVINYKKPKFNTTYNYNPKFNTEIFSIVNNKSKYWNETYKLISSSYEKIILFIANFNLNYIKLY